jgi:hypothetical protein
MAVAAIAIFVDGSSMGGGGGDTSKGQQGHKGECKVRQWTRVQQQQKGRVRGRGGFVYFFLLQYCLIWS